MLSNDSQPLGTHVMVDLPLGPALLFWVGLEVALVTEETPVTHLLRKTLAVQFCLNAGRRVEIETDFADRGKAVVIGHRSIPDDPRRHTDSKYRHEDCGFDETFAEGESAGEQQEERDKPNDKVESDRAGVRGSAQCYRG